MNQQKQADWLARPQDYCLRRVRVSRRWAAARLPPPDLMAFSGSATKVKISMAHTPYMHLRSAPAAIEKNLLAGVNAMEEHLHVQIALAQAAPELRKRDLQSSPRNHTEAHAMLRMRLQTQTGENHPDANCLLLAMSACDTE